MQSVHAHACLPCCHQQLCHPSPWPSPASSPLPFPCSREQPDCRCRAEPALLPAMGRSGQGPALIFHSYTQGREVVAKATSEMEVMLMFGLDPSSEKNIAVFWQFKTEGGSEKVFLSPCSLTLLCCVYPQTWHRKNIAFWVRQALCRMTGTVQ